MLRAITQTIIKQMPTAEFPNRNKIFYFDFLHSYAVNSSWENQTDTAKISFPKKVYFKDTLGNLIDLSGADITTGRIGDPVFLRGDKIRICAGYGQVDSSSGKEIKTVHMLFEGFITSIKHSTPIELTCEDNMFKLKQIKVPNKVFKGSEYTVEKILTELLAGTDFVVKTGTSDRSLVKTNIGDLRCQEATVAQVLETLKKDYNFFSYFRGKELRVGSIVYYPEDQNTKIFSFQENVIESELEYKRFEDIRIKMKAVGAKITAIGTNRAGSTKYKTSRVFAEVGDADGEVRTWHFKNTTDVATLKKLAEEKLNKVKFTGYHGKFKTFALPFVMHGNIVRLANKLEKEGSGDYLVKGVTYSGGMEGLRQEIEIDLRIDGIFSQDELNKGM